jgi:cobalt-precorrin 5A hydrolase/precorrin-3B C17-methyltransferase
VKGPVVAVSVTAAGQAVARRLPYPHRHGSPAKVVGDLWAQVGGLVLVCATGIAVRAVAPLLGGKGGDPAVVCVDDRARWAIALAGGHAAGANALATEVAAVLGAEPVVTTASEGAGIPALDALPGWDASGDIAGVTARWLEGNPPAVKVDGALAGWPLPAGLPSPAPSPPPASPATTVVRVTDGTAHPVGGVVVLRPPSLVVGVGASTGADPGGAGRLVQEALAGAGLDPRSVGAVATLTGKAAEPAVAEVGRRLGVALVEVPGPALAAVPVPNPSEVVAAAVGTPSVAEAAALVAAGPGASLVVTKHKSADATVAVARRRRPAGRLQVVGLGPGTPSLRTPAAVAAVRHADCVIGYGPYVDMAGDLLRGGQEVLRFPIGEEGERCRAALEQAAAGRRVALVCSGDPGVYAMAGLALELAPGWGSPPVEVIPGVTAALAASSVLGAPLAHDHAAVSLSDLLTPWEVIARRLTAVAQGDFAVTLYNPRSGRRRWQLGKALELLGEGRSPAIPAAVVTDAGRPGQTVLRATIGTLGLGSVGMTSVVVVGCSATRWVGERMVTARGYRTVPTVTDVAAEGYEP